MEGDSVLQYDMPHFVNYGTPPEGIILIEHFVDVGANDYKVLLRNCEGCALIKFCNLRNLVVVTSIREGMFQDSRAI